MRLRLTLPDGAVEAPRGSGRYEARLADRPWMRIEIAPLAPAAEDRAAWLKAILDDGIGDGAITKVLGATRAETRDQWPFEVIDAYVQDGDRLVEHRLVAVYDIIGHAAAVVVHATDSAAYAEALQPLLLPLLSTAEPDWRGREPVAVTELWSTDVSRPASPPTSRKDS